MNNNTGTIRYVLHADTDMKNSKAVPIEKLYKNIQLILLTQVNNNRKQKTEKLFSSLSYSAFRSFQSSAFIVSHHCNKYYTTDLRKKIP